MRRPDKEGQGCRFLNLILITVGSALIWACASAGISNFDLEPAVGDQVSFNHQGLTIISLYLNDDDRMEFLRAAGREALSREIRELKLTTFSLTVTNNSDREVIVDPAGIRFASGYGPAQSPMSYAQLYMALPRGAGRQTVLQEIQGIAFDKPVAIPPGSMEEGMLFFLRPEKVGREVAIVLDSLYLGGAQLKALLAFKSVSLEDE